MIEDITKITECPDCASTNIVHGSRDQVICRDCGLIFEPLAPGLEEKFEETHGISTPRAQAGKKSARKKAARRPAKKKGAPKRR